MKVCIDGAVLHLGRLLKDEFRNVERVRLTNLRPLLPALWRAKIPGRMRGKLLYVKVDDGELLMPWMSDAE